MSAKQDAAQVALAAERLVARARDRRAEWAADGRPEYVPRLVQEAYALDARDAAVLLAIADHADFNTGRGCFASQATLAVGARCSVKTVVLAVTALEKRGLIRRGDQSLATAPPGGGRKPLVYDVDVARVAAECRVPGTANPLRRGVRKPPSAEPQTPHSVAANPLAGSHEPPRVGDDQVLDQVLDQVRDHSSSPAPRTRARQTRVGYAPASARVRYREVLDTGEVVPDLAARVTFLHDHGKQVTTFLQMLRDNIRRAATSKQDRPMAERIDRTFAAFAKTHFIVIDWPDRLPLVPPHDCTDPGCIFPPCLCPDADESAEFWRTDDDNTDEQGRTHA